MQVVASGVIPTDPKQSHGERLHVIRDKILDIETRHGPLDGTVARERGFSKFHTSTQALYKCHGVIEEALYEYAIAEYTPSVVKKTLTGNHKAFKQQVADAVQQWLTSRVEFATDDESDALAVAICHLLKTGQLTEVSE